MDPVVACAKFDLDAVRKSLPALPGWTATTKGKLERAGRTTLDQTYIVLFVAPDNMMMEFRDGDGMPSREWYLGNRAWPIPALGLPEQKGVVVGGADEKRAAAMPLANLDLPGTFRIADDDSPGRCVLASGNGNHQVFATEDRVYAGERTSEMMDDGVTRGSVTIIFDPTVPVIPPPPT